MAVTEILKHTAEVSVFPMEDVLWTGILGKLAGVKHISQQHYIRMLGIVIFLEKQLRAFNSLFLLHNNTKTLTKMENSFILNFNFVI